MKTQRRSVLRGAAVGTGALGIAGCDRVISGLTRSLGQSVPGELDPGIAKTIDPDFHLLSRAAFGPWPGDLARVREMGREAWLDEQLHPERIDDSLCDLRARRFESLNFSAGDAYEFKKEVLREEITRHSLLRAVYSKRQLFEVMVEFWTDHLNIDLEKGDCIYLKPSDDRDVIRKHALGSFRDLIRASATSPAMLVYLDGRSNKVREGHEDVPNENYARELLELHTLGVHGGYTQADVREAARCLTGWTFDVKRKFKLNRGQTFFRDDWHDDGEKTVLGKVIPAGGGPADLDRLVEIACAHPSTARYVAEKLCRRFVGPELPATLVAEVAKSFSDSDGDIPTVLRTLLTSETFMQSRGVLLKRPFRFLVSALRALGADTHAPTGSDVVEYLSRMGHGLFQYPTPDGYPDEETPWMGTLMWRWNFALALAGNRLKGARVDLKPLSRALRAGNEKDHREEALWFAHLMGRSPSPEEKRALAGAVSKAGAASDMPKTELLGLMLASPAFQRC